MKQIIFFLLLLASMKLGAQVQTGSIAVANFGDNYRISHVGQASNNINPKPDSASLRVVVICPSSMTFEVNNVPVNSVLKYKLSGTIYISSSIIWWKNGAKKGRTDMPTICGFFTNPINCFQKL